MVDTRVNAVDGDAGDVYGVAEGAAHVVAADPVVDEQPDVDAARSGAFDPGAEAGPVENRLDGAAGVEDLGFGALAASARLVDVEVDAAPAAHPQVAAVRLLVDAVLFVECRRAAGPMRRVVHHRVDTHRGGSLEVAKDRTGRDVLPDAAGTVAGCAPGVREAGKHVGEQVDVFGGEAGDVEPVK